jgi:hypothetical protein
MLPLHALRSGLAATVVIAVAVGCAGIPFTNKSKEPSGVASATPLIAPKSAGGTHPIAAFLAAARAGDSTYLTLPETGKRVRVTAHRLYFAASGRYCRHFEVTVTNSPSTTTPGLACKNVDQDWELQNLIVNPNDVNAPQRSLLYQ